MLCARGGIAALMADVLLCPMSPGRDVALPIPLSLGGGDTKGHPDVFAIGTVNHTYVQNCKRGDNQGCLPFSIITCDFRKH